MCASKQISMVEKTAMSNKNTDSCPEKKFSMTIIEFIITQNCREQN